MKNIYEIIRQEAAQRTEERIALKDGACSLTYAELFDRVDRVAALLSAQKICPGSRVALFCTDSIDYVIASLAILAVRAVVVPVPPTAAEHEADALLLRIGADFLLFDRDLRTGGEPLPSKDSFIEKTMMLKELEHEPPPEEFEKLNPAFIRFSSGTTGESKGVLLSHEAILERTDAADRGLEITEDDTVLWVLSMSFHFVVSILLFLRRGATVSLCYNNFPLSLLDAVKKGDGTFIYASPFHYYTMMASAAFQPESLSGVRMAVSTSMKLPADTADAFSDKFGFKLTEAYGIIEVGLPFLNRSPGTARGSVGHILPDFEVMLKNKDADGVGEIYIRGKGMFDAYMSPWKPHCPDGWFCTGDLGRFDDAENLYLVGRKKNLINFMGMKVFPDEVEAVLNTHPCVEESLVHGEPHPRFGQLPVAQVVRSADVDEMVLRQYCHEELSPYKTPKTIRFVDHLPKTPSGKLFRDI